MVWLIKRLSNSAPIPWAVHSDKDDREGTLRKSVHGSAQPEQTVVRSEGFQQRVPDFPGEGEGEFRQRNLPTPGTRQQLYPQAIRNLRNRKQSLHGHGTHPRRWNAPPDQPPKVRRENHLHLYA